MNGTSGFQQVRSSISRSPHRIGCFTSNGLNSKQVPGIFSVLDHPTKYSQNSWWKLSAALFVLAIACQFSACVRVYVAVDKSQTENPEADDHKFPPIPPDDLENTSPCFLKSQVPSAKQQTGSWCWAASAQLVVEYLTGVPAPQCDLVSDVFHGDLKTRAGSSGEFRKCCNSLPANPDASIPDDLADICDRGGWPQWALDKRNIEFIKKDQAIGLIEWKDLTHEICEDRPFIFVVRWNRGGRHSAVGGGYQTTQNFGNFLEVYDHSADEFYVMPLREFQGGGSFVREFDYIDLRRRP